MAITTVNPATGKTIATYDEMSDSKVASCIDACHQATKNWASSSLKARAAILLRMAELLIEKKDECAALMTREMGKPLAAALSEVEKCALTCRHFAQASRQYLASRTIRTEFSKSKVIFAPIGIVFAIMPWNFPFWQVFRFAVPAMMAGNGALLKHAPITTGCGILIEKLFAEAGAPSGLFRTLVIDPSQSEAIIQNPLVSAVTLTGSDRTGRTVAAMAGRALKKIVLELGGSDPYIVLEDADLALAVDSILSSRLGNAGQSCIAAKRILVAEPIRQAFLDLLLQKMSFWVEGNPEDSRFNVGPLARADLRENLHRQVQDSVRKGATLLKGGTLPEGPGFYYPVTVLANVQKGMPAWCEELFGPVISLIDVKNEIDAIAVANDTPYGLGAAVFTGNVRRGERLAAKIQAGTVFVNDFVRSDPRLPFGGIRCSGFGRELSLEGIREFTNIKTICVR